MHVAGWAQVWHVLRPVENQGRSQFWINNKWSGATFLPHVSVQIHSGNIWVHSRKNLGAHITSVSQQRETPQHVNSGTDGKAPMQDTCYKTEGNICVSTITEGVDAFIWLTMRKPASTRNRKERHSLMTCHDTKLRRKRDKHRRQEKEKWRCKHKKKYDDAFILLTAHSPASRTGENITRQQHGKKRKVRRRGNEKHVLTFDLIHNWPKHENRGKGNIYCYY